jgi:hypothetical protein
MTSYADDLQRLYDGEVGGEALYSGLLASATDADERLKWSTLLQLETETKAWLRAPMIAHGLGIEERDTQAERISAFLEQIRPLSWPGKMQRLHDALKDRVIPAYQAMADAARARGNAAEEAVCDYMVEHEEAQIEFARRELAGARLDEALEPLVKFLRYPIRG